MDLIGRKDAGRHLINAQIKRAFVRVEVENDQARVHDEHEECLGDYGGGGDDGGNDGMDEQGAFCKLSKCIGKLCARWMYRASYS